MGENYLSDWARRREEAVAEEERRLEQAGVIAYCEEESRAVIVFESGAVVDFRAYFYPEGPFFEFDVEPPMSRP